MSQKCIPPLPPYTSGLVLRGYDLVEYFNKAGLKTGDPVFVKGTLGSSKYKVKSDREGAIYEFWFVNKENKDKFIKNPHRYLPQYGGFCSWGIASEYNKNTVPPNCYPNCDVKDSWVWTKFVMGPPGEPSNGATIYRGKLYLNYWFKGGSDMKRCFFYQKTKHPDKKACSPYLPKTTFPTEFETNEYIRRANKRWIKYYGNLKLGPYNVKCYPGDKGPGISDLSCLALTSKQKKCIQREIKNKNQTL